MTSFKKFKELRSKFGSNNAILCVLIRSGVPHFIAIEGTRLIRNEFGWRELELSKSKDIYEVIEGFLQGFRGEVGDRADLERLYQSSKSM